MAPPKAARSLYPQTGSNEFYRTNSNSREVPTWHKLIGYLIDDIRSRYSSALCTPTRN